MFSNLWFSIAINICISLFLIYGIHLFWNHIKDNYSKPKTKNLVNSQIEKYKKIIDEIQQSRTLPQLVTMSGVDEKQQMYNELTDFMNTELAS
jgi:hypothetical protein